MFRAFAQNIGGERFLLFLSPGVILPPIRVKPRHFTALKEYLCKP